MKVKKRERGGERMDVCVCVREREREREWMCVCVIHRFIGEAEPTARSPSKNENKVFFFILFYSWSRFSTEQFVSFNFGLFFDEKK
jgi:hypothetical protein